MPNTYQYVELLAYTAYSLLHEKNSHGLAVLQILYRSDDVAKIASSRLYVTVPPSIALVHGLSLFQRARHTQR